MNFEEMDMLYNEKELEEHETPILTGVREFKCKVAYNYQSVEFSFIGTIEDFENQGALEYARVLNALQIATDSVILPTTIPVKKEKLASEKQKEIMDKFHIPYTEETTSKQAQALIEDSIKAANG